MQNIFVYNPRMNLKNILAGSAGYVVSVSFALYMLNIYLAKLSGLSKNHGNANLRILFSTKYLLISTTRL